MKIHNFFPLSILQDQIRLTDQEKINLIDDIRVMKSNSQNSDYKLNKASWTGDTQGFEFLYAEKSFSKLFELISLNIKKYTELIGINNEKIDFYYQRAWATISKNNENIKPHKHNQSHISFAYYLKKNKSDGNINFHNDSLQNEIAPAIFKGENEKQQSIFKNNLDNARIITVSPEVDELYVFPSKTAHSTSSNKTNDERMSISADISIVAKSSENIEHLLTPINKWKKF